MFRVVALWLALLMPLQVVWAAAAAHCQHETTPAASRHAGHHEHVHTADAKKASTAKVVIDDDCTSCHASLTALASEPAGSIELPPTTRQLLVAQADAHASALARAPDRPQWPRLA